MKNSVLKSLVAYLMLSFLAFAVMATDINKTNTNSIDNQRPNNISDQKWANLKSAVQEEKLVPTPSGIGGQYAHFGNSISVDGNRVLIGAPRNHDDAVTNPQGAATIMEYDEATETWSETAILMADDGFPENNFGVSVSLSGNRALIGAHLDNDSGFTRSGAAYIFDFDANTNSWTQSQKLTASDLMSNDFFGFSVSLSGDRALIGSFGDNGRKGSAYVFDLDSQSNNWVESQKLLSSDGAANDLFAYSVSLLGDRALIGAFGDTGRLGSAYIFDFDNNANNWQESKKLLASDGADDDQFGFSVSLSNDRLLIGATDHNDRGSAYIFDYILDNNTNTNIWTETHKLIPDDLNTLSFGSAVSLSGDKVLIGAKDHRHPGNVFFLTEGAAYVFELDTNTDTWERAPILTSDDALSGDDFGTSVSLSGDWVMVGAPLNNNQGNYSGSAYFFESINSPFGIIWQQKQQLMPTDSSSYDQFGYSVSLSGDRALIGAYEDGFKIDDSFSRSYSGSAYIFDFDNNTNSWTFTQKLTPDDIDLDAEFGKTVSLSGNRALIGAHKDGEIGSNIGAAYIFDLDVNTNTWSKTQKLLPDVDSGSSFGTSVSLSGDRALVGMENGFGITTRTGSAYIFDLNTNTNNWEKSQILFADDGTDFADFGSAVNLLEDRAVIGAPSADNDAGVSAGSAYVFDFDTNNNTWLQTFKLLADDGASNDRFGSSVSQTQDRILIGAYLDDDMGSNSGSVYVFKYSASVPSWVQEQKIVPADGATNNNFGRSVSLYGNRALIGASSATFSSNSITAQSSAYVFDLDSNTGSWSQSQKLTASDGLVNDAFGVAVSLYGDKALIGASLNDGNGIESGAAYVLNLDTYDVSVNVTGLAPGNSIELLNNGDDNITVNADSIATFPTSVINGRGYNVTVKSPQPTTPNQNCVVTDPIGTINSSDVELAVTCTTIQYDIVVTVKGLDENNSIELKTNGQSLGFSSNITQNFAMPIDDETTYAVLLTAQPTSPNQTCTITGGNSGDNNGSGTVAGQTVAIVVECFTAKYNLDVTVAGLDSNNSIELMNNSQSIVFTIDGMQSFIGINDGSDYAVLLTAQPTNPNQTCTITGGNSGDNNGSGTVAGEPVAIAVDCMTTQYNIDVSVTGLGADNSIELTSNSLSLVFTSDGTQSFVGINDGSDYAVLLTAQPTSPNQTCTITGGNSGNNNGSGTLAGETVTIAVDCSINQYMIGGIASGLANGSSVTLSLGAEDLEVNSNDVFLFLNTLADESHYIVSITDQPTVPNQTCEVVNPSGTIAGDDVDNMEVNCVTNLYTIGGTVIGLHSGNNLVIQNNDADDLAISSDGDFDFMTAIEDSQGYSVSIDNQPSNPIQLCELSGNSGNVSGNNVTSVLITCDFGEDLIYKDGFELNQ